MNMEEPYKMGFLCIPPQSFLRKTWIKRYCALYIASNQGIERIELFETEDTFVKQNPCKIIPLTDCIKVTPAPQKQQPNVFEVRTKNNNYQFSADTFQDMSEWLISLQTVAFGKNEHKTSSLMPLVKEEKQEENMLYSSVDEPEIYNVKAVATEATLRNNLKGDYKLIISPIKLSIAEECSQGRMGRIILTWPYRHIRRYGCGTETFTFEAGRKCTSGEGLFTFTTNAGMLIFQSVDAYVLALKSSQNEGDIPNSPSLNEDKSSFFTALDSLSGKKDFPSHHAFKKKSSLSLLSGSELEVSHQDLPNRPSASKPVPPLTKPPRKSKNRTAQLFSSDILLTAEPTSENSSFSSNIYEELYRESSDNLLSDTFCQSSTRKSSLSVASEESLLCHATEKMKVYDVANEKMNTKHAHSFCNYENCDSLYPNKRATFSGDHLYGKLLPAKPCSPGETGNTYGSLFPKNNSVPRNVSSHVYSNVPLHDPCVHDVQQQTVPDHFIQNDAEYALVSKKNRYSS